MHITCLWWMLLCRDISIKILISYFTSAFYSGNNQEIRVETWIVPLHRHLHYRILTGHLITQERMIKTSLIWLRMWMYLYLSCKKISVIFQSHVSLRVNRAHAVRVCIRVQQSCIELKQYRRILHLHHWRSLCIMREFACFDSANNQWGT